MPDAHTTLALNNTTLRLVQGDITEAEVDAIVNAANSSLLGGGGVDGAIHRRGGPDILAACRTIRRNEYPDGLPTGQAVITTGGDLPAHHVIHTVGPIWRGGSLKEAELLADAYRNSLEVARHHTLRSIAFPSISTGVYNFPIEKATPIALKTTSETIKKHPDAFDEVRFVLFSQSDFRTYGEALIALK
jgi:O-acetyl-ADP-ribose deacetylase (regulator of RNase III)